MGRSLARQLFPRADLLVATAIREVEAVETNTRKIRKEGGETRAGALVLVKRERELIENVKDCFDDTYDRHHWHA